MHPKQPSWTVSLAVKNLWQISIGARFPCRSSTGPRANVNRSPAIVAMLPPRLLPVAVIGIYCGNVHSLKPGKQHKPCVFRISLPQMALRNLKKGLQTAQRFAQISGLVPDTVQPVRVGGLTPWGPRMTYLYSSLFELEDACDLPECELRHSAGKNWIGVYMIQHKMEQQLWDGLCILCISIYFRFFQYVLYLHDMRKTRHIPTISLLWRAHIGDVNFIALPQGIIQRLQHYCLTHQGCPMVGQLATQPIGKLMLNPSKLGTFRRSPQFSDSPSCSNQICQKASNWWRCLDNFGDLCVFWRYNGHESTEAPRQAEPKWTPKVNAKGDAKFVIG